MKLYKISYAADGFREQSWAGTQADMRAESKAVEAYHHEQHGFRPLITTEEVEVPTSKAELLEFLNKNCTREEFKHDGSNLA